MSEDWDLARGAFPYVSALRIYEPLDTFADSDQSTILEQRGVPRPQTEWREARAARQRNLRLQVDPFPHVTAELFRTIAYESQSGVNHYYSPSQVALRSKIAAAEMMPTLPERLRSVLFPESAVEAHFIRTETPDTNDVIAPLIYSMHSSWGVPVAWFVAFSPQDVTHVVEEDGRVVTIHIHTPLPVAVDRIRRAVAAIATKAPDLDILDGLTAISEWFDSFSPHAILELDYGPVADFVFPDESIEDVMLGIESIAEGDLTAAAAAYRRLTSRWIPVRQRARAS